MAAIRTKRVQKELAEVARSQDAMFALYPTDRNGGNLMHLSAWIAGPPDTAYEGGRFYLDIKIPNRYPFAPPEVKFVTKLWHPNISSATGLICLDILKDQWVPSMSIRSVLLSLISLLQNPVPDDPQDGVVAAQLMHNKDLFEKTAAFWTSQFGEYVDLKKLKVKDFPDFEDKIRMFRTRLPGLNREAAIVGLSNANWDVAEAVRRA